MAVKLIPAVARPVPEDRPLWRLVRAGRAAVAVARVYGEIPDGVELRISLDHELRFARLFRGPGLDAEALAKRRALEAIGFCE